MIDGKLYRSRPADDVNHSFIFITAQPQPGCFFSDNSRCVSFARDPAMFSSAVVCWGYRPTLVLTRKAERTALDAGYGYSTLKAVSMISGGGVGASGVNASSTLEGTQKAARNKK